MDHVANENEKISANVESLIRGATIFVMNVEHNIRTDIHGVFTGKVRTKSRLDDRETVTNIVLTAFEFY